LILFSGDTQIICSPMALDGNNIPDVLAINAASAALVVSDIPWNGPSAAVRVAFCSGELVVNPTKRELSHSSLNLIVTATKQNLVIMLEGVADNILLSDFQHAIKFGVKECQNVIAALEDLRREVGHPKREVAASVIPDDVSDALRSLAEMRLREIFSDASHDKISRDVAVNVLRADVMEKLADKESAHVTESFQRLVKDVFRTLIFESDVRCDGRRLTQLRNISCQVDLYKPLHGSALFQRGQTQVVCSVALDSPNSAMKMDAVSVLTR